MDKYIDILRAIGIHEHGAQTYLALLEGGEQSIADLTKSTGLHRVEIYRQLPQLLETGLVKEIPNGKRKLYSATSPYQVQHIYKKQQLQTLQSMQQLVSDYGEDSSKPLMSYNTGKTAIMQVFSDMVDTLEPGSVIYRVSSENGDEKAQGYIPSDYIESRNQKQLERFVIMSADGAQTKTPDTNREMITIPPELDDFEDNVSLTIYGNKIAYINLNSESVITLEHREFVEFQRKMFRIMFISLAK